MIVKKISNGYTLSLSHNVSVFFDSYDKSCRTGVSLNLDGRLVCFLYFEQATEFYKAWRDMK